MNDEKAREEFERIVKQAVERGEDSLIIDFKKIIHAEGKIKEEIKNKGIKM